MLKWLLTVLIVVLAIGAVSPKLRRIGFGRLPGDIVIERNGKQYFFPVASTVLLSLLASLVFWMLR